MQQPGHWINSSYFYRCVPHRDLHSFPTRRSSDLMARSATSRRFCCKTTLAHPARHRETDRKSTRLNSSHVAISYAVFCLKKKKRHSELALAIERALDKLAHKLHMVPIELLIKKPI